MVNFVGLAGVPGATLIFIFSDYYHDLGKSVDISVVVLPNGYISATVSDISGEVLYRSRGSRTSAARLTFREYMEKLVERGGRLAGSILFIENVTPPRHVKLIARRASREARSVLLEKLGQRG